MSHTQTDTTDARPQEGTAQATTAGPGKHRGRAAASEETQPPARGRHRRPQQNPQGDDG